MTSFTEAADSNLSRENWLEELAFLQLMREKTFSRAGSVYDAGELIDIDCDRLAIAAAIANDFDQAAEAAGETAAVGAAAVLVAVLASGEVSLAWPEGNQFRVPTGGAPPSPVDWLLSVASALMVRDPESIAVLCAPEHILAVSKRPGEVDAFWEPFCAALSAVVRNSAYPEALLRDAESLLGETQITNGNPRAIEAHAGILIPLLRILSSGGDWPAALENALSAYHRYYKTEGRPGDPLRLMPIAITGLAALAFDRGISSEGLPNALVRGEFPRAHVRVAFEYHRRLAERVDDPAGFLDLECYPADHRRHVLGTREDGEFVARYDLSRNGLPHAVIEFLLPKPDRKRPAAMPPALDPGERLLLAGMYADRVRQANLRDAVDQVDAVLATIPPDADAVPESAFVNPRGIDAYREEPGRFRRNRLLAYRGALASRLPSVAVSATSGRPSLPADLGHYREALAAAEIVKQNILPLLDALRKDRDGRIVERLRPRPEDYASVFEAAIVDTARTAYESIWKQVITVECSSAETETRVAVSPAGMLRGDNDLSNAFPGGYRGIAQWLKPRHVWASWKYVEPGKTSGMAYDGLVWCDDHWAWFPKPYRVLGAETRPS
jgi:hypothetical protein